MARFRHYIQSVISGYVALGANILYTLCSVPLALAYLSDAEFGLWALAAQIGFYLALVDFGMTGATSRILIDYKDHRNASGYGTVVRTAIAVNIAQGLLVLCFGAAAAFVLGGLLNIPPGLRHVFSVVVLGQTGVLAAGFAVKILGQVLQAHHRADIGNYAQVGSFVANFAVLYVCFESGAGVYSVIWAQLAGLLLGTGLMVIACVKFGLLPAAASGAALFDTHKFKEFLSYGKDVFLFTVGSQVINGAHLIIISRLLGLEAAAVWSICTRMFVLAGQLVWRVMEFSAPALSEMFVRGERDRLLLRFRGLTMVTTSLAAAAAVTFVACNQPFVAVWAGSQFTWPIRNDVLLMSWFVLSMLQRGHIALLGVMKQLGVAKYVYFAEGISFILLGFAGARQYGITGLIAASFVSTAAFSCVYGLTQTRRQFRLSWKEVLYGWSVPTIRVLMVAAPLAALICLLTARLDPWPKLIIRAGLTVPLTMAVLWRFGLTRELQKEITEKSPPRLRGALSLSLRTFESIRRQA